MIRIAIADDHAVVREGLSRVVAIVPDFNLLIQAKNGHELLQQLETQDVDLVLTDINMPGVSGIELIKALKDRFPALAVVVFSMHSESQIASQAIKAGASGYLTKDTEPEILLSAIRRCAGGGHFISTELASALLFADVSGQESLPHRRLSEREMEIFLLLANGIGINDIGERLHISAKTVSTHKSRLMQKMSLDSMSELVRYALRHDFITF
jgi:DNA-binding NarL/FixJ family response regulator